MTRKRFVKLCMAKGYSRNEANLMASEVIGDGTEYDSAYCEALLYAIVPAAVEAARRAVEKLTEEIARAIPTICEAIAAAIPQIIEAAKNIQRQIEEMTDGIIDA